jgi:iron complex transport system permease protein
MTPGAYARLLAALAALTLVMLLVSLLTGPDGFGLPAEERARRLVLVEIRLPRALLAALIGAALALSGAALQGYLGNPLAEPGLLGVSSGAALGAVVAIHSGAAAAFALALPLGGLAGAALATIVILLLAGRDSGPVTLILAGVAISSVASALTSLALNLTPNPFASVEIVFWLMGSLADRSLVHLWLALPLIVAGGVLLLATGPALDALALGEAVAANLGFSLDRVRMLVVAGTALAVGAATAIAGTIAFVGLVVPHLVRPLVGQQPSRVLPASALAGAALVLAADVVLRLVSPAGDVKLGVLTALLGAPFFLWLVLATRRELGP